MQVKVSAKRKVKYTCHKMQEREESRQKAMVVVISFTQNAEVYLMCGEKVKKEDEAERNYLKVVV